MVLALVSVLACARGSQPEATSLQGAWRIVEVTAPDGSTNGNPQPSLFIFTTRHYSMLRVGGSEPRALMADTARRSTITDAELKTMVMPFFANSGTYELQGATLMIRPTVALWPNYMASGADTMETTLAGDTLRLTHRSGGDLGARWTLLRQE